MKINLPMLIWDVINLPAIVGLEEKSALNELSKKPNPTREDVESLHVTAGMRALSRVAFEVLN